MADALFFAALVVVFFGGCAIVDRLELTGVGI